MRPMLIDPDVGREDNLLQSRNVDNSISMGKISGSRPGSIANWTRLVPNCVVAFGGVTVGSNKAKEHAQVVGISSLIGCVSVDRATAEVGAISVNPQTLKGSKRSVPNWKSHSSHPTPHQGMR